MPIRNLSAAKLCKQSAAQILFLETHHKQVVVTPEQVAGIKYQKQQVNSKYQEMCGAYSLTDKTVYFSWDEIQVKSGGILRFIEHKQVADTYEDWYLRNSLLQTAVYAALTLKTPKLQTAKFYVNNGNPENKLNCKGASRRFYLKFGQDTYKITLIDSSRLLKFIKDKSKALNNYEDARAFDAKWKRNEFEKLKKCFSFKKAQIK